MSLYRKKESVKSEEKDVVPVTVFSQILYKKKNYGRA